MDYFKVVSVSMVDDLLRDKKEWQYVGCLCPTATRSEHFPDR